MRLRFLLAGLRWGWLSLLGLLRARVFRQVEFQYPHAHVLRLQRVLQPVLSDATVEEVCLLNRCNSVPR
jgi:hypothetical protein